jgi:hypothetical protein
MEAKEQEKTMYSFEPTDEQNAGSTQSGGMPAEFPGAAHDAEEENQLKPA